MSEHSVLRSKRGILLLSCIAAAILVGVGVLMYFLVFRDTWEEDNRETLAILYGEAAHLMAQGKQKDAYDKYEELLKTVKGHTIRSPYLRGRLDEAREAKDKLYPHVAAQIEEE
ncbi:MAG TPA: hypothetical protein VNA25_07560, partial [Phycisphaerae bacterium]|nr:hypothetical protein [Phycisphaerae bacterium]